MDRNALKIRLAAVAVGLLVSLTAYAGTFNLFQPASGILVGNPNTYVTTAASSSNVRSLWSGTCDSSTYLRGDGTCQAPPGTGGGTVNSVGLTAPSVFSVTGSPVTTTGTLAIAFATGQTANRFLASPDGSTGAISLRAIVADDLPAISLTTGVTSTLPVANGGTGAVTLTANGVLLGNGTSAVSAVALSGDQLLRGVTASAPTAATLPSCNSANEALNYNTTTHAFSCATISAGTGTVTSVAQTMPSVFSVTGSPVTTSGTLAVTFATGQTQNQVLASPNGSSGAVALRALVGADIPQISLGASGNGGVTGNLPVTNLNGGTSASASTVWYGDGTWKTPPSAVSGANPSATIGLTAVNGVATTYTRSDGAPALSQSIAPTWTGNHIFNPASGVPFQGLRSGVDGAGDAAAAIVGTDGKTIGDSNLFAFRLRDSANNTTDYAFIGAEIVSPTNGAESGTFGVYTMSAGSGPSKRFSIRPDGQVQAIAGSAGTPAYSFSGDTNTGVYSAGGDILALSTGGNVAVSMNTAAIFPFLPIQAAGTGTNAAPDYSFNGDTDTGVYRLGADQIGFAGSGVLRVSVLSDANNVLGLYNSGSIKAYLATDGSGAGIFSGSNETGNGFYVSGTGAIVQASGATQATITSSGVAMASATGGAQGSGSINATALYVNGVSVGAATGDTQTAGGLVSHSGCSGSSSNTNTFNRSGQIVTVRIPPISCVTTGSPTLQCFTMGVTYPSGFAPTVTQMFPISMISGGTNITGIAIVNTGNSIQFCSNPSVTLTGTASNSNNIGSGVYGVTITYTRN